MWTGVIDMGSQWLNNITITSVFADLDDMKSAEEFEDNEPNYGVQILFSSIEFKEKNQEATFD